VRDLCSFLITNVDGYYQGPDGEFDWPVVDAEFSAFSAEQLDEADTLLFGRRTYEVMAAYWPQPAAAAEDPEVATRMNALPKLVASGTLERADWPGTRVLGEDLEAEITRLKQQPGRKIAVLGSSELTASLVEWGLLDELRIMVSPIALGAGRPVLAGLARRVSMSLVGARTFESGNVLHSYRPDTLGS